MILRTVFALVVSVIALPAWAEVNIQEVRSDGGFTAWLVEDHSIPFTALELRFRGGAVLDEPGKKGATNLMVGLLEEGAGDLDARGFATATESLAARFSYSVSDDFVSISAEFLTENADQAVALLRDSLVAPRFDEEAVERVRQQVISGITSDQKSPRDLASQALRRLIYGDHPYAQSKDGTLESVSALTRADLVTAHQVLHFMDEPRQLVAVAASMLKSGGRLVVVDFLPHALEDLRSDHAHRRLGFGDAEIRAWFAEAGLTPEHTLHLPGRTLTVGLWSATRAAGDQEA